MEEKIEKQKHIFGRLVHVCECIHYIDYTVQSDITAQAIKKELNFCASNAVLLNAQ